MHKRWAGRWIAGVGVVHCAVAALLFSEPLLAIVRDGIWNAVDGYSGRPLAFWFFMLGLLTILFGLLVDRVELQVRPFPRSVALGFAVLTVIGVISVPVGGGWLFIPAAVGLLMKAATVEGAT